MDPTATLRVVPVLLAGGLGTRLGPLSTPETPKPFLRPGPGPSLLIRTALRVAGAPYAAPRIVLAAHHCDRAEAELAEAGLAAGRIIAEPVGRSTGAAVALAALDADPGEFLLILPTDHDLDGEVLRTAVLTALPAAGADRIVAFGVPARGIETRLGHLLADAPGADGASRVSRFVEKPDEATARALLATGRAHWNAGILLARAGTLAGEFDQRAPAIADTCRAALAAAKRTGNRLAPGETALLACPALPVDRALLETTGRLVLVPLGGRWLDLGVPESYEAIARKEPP